jgi:hypothetical protein
MVAFLGSVSVAFQPVARPQSGIIKSKFPEAFFREALDRPVIPDSKWGERVALAVVLREGQALIRC